MEFETQHKKEKKVIEFNNLREMFAWRAKFAPKHFFVGSNGNYVINQIEVKICAKR